MYEQYYGFREKPFSLLPDPSFLFPSRKHQMALTMLEYGLTNQAPISVVTGEVGSGKTTLVRALLNQLPDNLTIGTITNTHAEIGDLLQWVMMSLGQEFRNKEKVELYNDFVMFLINEYAQGRRTVLIIDEAQNLPAGALEELRMLSNVNVDKDQVLQLMLVGQPELRATLNRVELRQFAQRVASSYHLEPLTRDETHQYIAHRIQVAGGDPAIFSEAASDKIWYHSRGIPRVVNTLCDVALVYGYAEQQECIDVPLIQDVIKDRKDGGFFTAQAAGAGPA